MSTRDKAPVGSPCWVDLWTSDTEGSRRFYSDLFGWEAQAPSPEFGGYFMFTRDGVPVAGGMGDMGEARANNTWKLYLATDDAAKTVEAAEAAGAQVIVPPMEVADLGVQAIITDPTGATVGVWEARTFPGNTVLAEHGAPGWFELLTRDYTGAVDFYRSVFQWETRVVSDTDNFRYTTMRDPEADLAGIMDASAFLGEGCPSSWSVYFGVDDAEAAVALVESLGGSVVRPPEDTPYGRLATVADPAGAQFKLVAPNAAMPAQAS
jgi:predicted enzyme related to lactoylglutathione lyase